jgi:hypothetical protein
LPSLVSPTLTTAPGPTVVLGSTTKLTDTATLAGGSNLTGNILFTLASGGKSIDVEIVGVNGNGTYSTPTGYTPSGTGTFQWTASYTGDVNNNAAGPSSPESEKVSAASPTLATTPGATIVQGSGAKLTDSAALSGGFNPTGTITFTLVAPNGATVGTPATVTVTGNATYTAPGVVPSTSGTYTWKVSYSGDSNNSAASPSSAETEIVNPAGHPSLTTKAGGTIVFGSLTAKLNDSATLASGLSPTGSILFSLTSPQGGIVYTDVVTIKGNGTYSTKNPAGSAAGGYAPTSTGTYHWTASYSGDTHNSAVTASGTEVEHVKFRPTLTPAPGGSVVLGSGVELTDSATLVGGSSPTGTITFTLVAPGGLIVFATTVQVTSKSTYKTPGGYSPGKPGTYHWMVRYSGDANNTAVTAGAEPEVVTIPPSAGLRWGRA